MANEVFDFYVDNFAVTLTPWGASLSFARSKLDPTPTDDSDESPSEVLAIPEHLGSVRMSTQLLKLISLSIAKQVRDYEQSEGAVYSVAPKHFERANISKEEWDEFWR
jgi:hypothetical protein